jgi:nucleoside-diphosphate-sugar epimerase
VHVAFLGGTRFIGRAAARRALSRGHTVSVLHRGRHPCEDQDVQDVLVDRADPSALSETLARVAPDVVVDTRAMTRADAQVTALACRIVGAPAVVLSSVDVYAQFGRLNGQPAPEPELLVTEGSPLGVSYPFRGLSTDLPDEYDKKEVEAELERAVSDGVPGVLVLRLPAVYGDGDYRRRFGAVVDRLDAGERALPCAGGASFRQAHAHVADVAHAMVLGAEQHREGFLVLNVSERETPTMSARVEAIVRTMGLDFEWREGDPVPDELAFLGAMPNDLVVSSAKLRERLGFAETTSEDERLRDLIRWLRVSRARE